MQWVVHRKIVPPEQAGMRLDQFLPAAVENLSRTLVRKVIDIGGVHVNGQRIRTCSAVLAATDLVELYLDNQPLEPYRIRPEDVVFQDNYLIVLNKRAMIETQPTHARYKGTLYEALQLYLKNPFRPHQKPVIGMIQRLDRSTSGLIVFSTHPSAHKKMTKMFQVHAVEKQYLALVAGQPNQEHGEIRSLLARSHKENRVHSVQAGGKLAITRYALQRSLIDSSLVLVQILTGRSHQIRAHMAELKCPLLGDQRYGGPTARNGLIFSRPMLHSYQLNFNHPVSDQRLEFCLPMAHDMQQAIQSLERN